MGTYSDEDPNASIGEKIANSLSKIVGLPKKSNREPSEGTDPSGAQVTAQQGADAASSDGGKIGRMKQAQSTDRDNSYSF